MGRTTVLEQYQRLEAEGIWRPDPDAQRRDVIISIGEATLTLSDPNEQVLTHWSLPALSRKNPGATPAIYTPGADAPDTLEIRDAEMIEALERVSKAIRRGQSHPGRLRTFMLLGVSAVLVFLLVFWLPGALTRYTASILPEVAEDAIGDGILAQITRVAGQPCASPSGTRALARLDARLFPEGGKQLVVLPSALNGTAHLPGGRILIDHRLIEDFDTPNAVANAVLAENTRLEVGRPIETVLGSVGIGPAFRLLTTGDIGEAPLARYAELIIAESAPVSPPVTAPDDQGPVLSDSDWIALQQICEG